MSVTNHIAELRRKHATLAEKVEEAQRALGSADAEIAELKKQKLQIKEEIARLEAS